MFLTRVKKYQPPRIGLLLIEVEDGIAANSGIISPGDGGTSNTPSFTQEQEEINVQDWNFVE